MLIDTTIVVITDPEPARAPGGGQRFRIDPTGPNDIFADAGIRPGSINVGISLHPVIACPGVGDIISDRFLGGVYCDACGQKVNDKPGPIAWHEPTQECIDNYELDIQQGAIYLDMTLEEALAFQKQFQRVIDDNPDWAG